MKPPLCLSVVFAFSLLSCNLFAGGGKPPLADGSPHSDSASAFSAESGTLAAQPQAVIPGPQRSFLRMAGISQKIEPDEVLPLLSRNVFTEGFEITRPTEFLILLRRYVVQARELAALAAGSGMVIRVSNCDDARPLLQILGYRTRADCGTPGTSLQTEDPERAFLAIDSGFPLPELERTLQGGKPFEYSYLTSPLPVLFAEGDWTRASTKNYKENSRDLLDTILADQSVARLYWALSRLDPETRNSLQQSIGLGKLLPYAAVLDFYGRGISISAGRVNVPGGPAADASWKDLVGASPAAPAAFIPRLLAKDKGWLVAYFDALSRVTGARQAYFTDPRRLRFFLRRTARARSCLTCHARFIPTGACPVAAGQSNSAAERWYAAHPRESRYLERHSPRAQLWLRSEGKAVFQFERTRSAYTEDVRSFACAY